MAFENLRARAPFRVFDNTGTLVALIDVNGITLYGQGTAQGSILRLALSTGIPIVGMLPPPIVGHTYAEGSIQSASNATDGANLTFTPPLDSGKLNSLLRLWSQGDSTHPPRADFATDFFQMTGVVLPECDVQNNGFSQPRGWRQGAFKTSDSVLVAGVETTINFTVGTMWCRANRVYECRFSGVFSSTNGVIVRLRKTQLVGGALVFDMGSLPTGGFIPPPPPVLFANTGADVALDFNVTIQTGAGNAQWLGNGQRPSGFSIWDVGDAGAMNAHAPFTLL
jgi:hypothetical protein